MAEEGSEQLRREIGYYKRRLDELAGETLRLDYKISGLRKEVLQRRQAFTLLSRLQQTVGARRGPSDLFELVLREINATLGMDKTIVLTPSDREDHYRPTRWTGFTEEGRSTEFETRMLSTTILFPHEFCEGTGRILVNRQTKPTPLVEQLRETFELPFFLCVPVSVERKPIGLLMSGRMKEAGTVFPPIDQADLETFVAIAGLISASLENIRISVLRETDRLKTEFFANVSHEFRTPITLTLGPLEQLLAGRYGPLSGEAREWLMVMQRSQENLLGLINQILNLSKLEAGADRLKPARVPHLTALIEKRVAQFRPAAAHRGIDVRLSLDSGVDGADLYVDCEKFDRLLFNLLSNALKFTREGHIAVSTWLDEEAVYLEVTDTGVGIKEDQLPYIFDRFRQADGSESREFAGTGIGLALVAEITKLHGGEVGVFSRYGKGSAFRVRIPLGRDHLGQDSLVERAEDDLGVIGAVFHEDPPGPEGNEKQNGETEASFDAERPTVLCAEDNPAMRRHLRDVLQSEYNVFLAADGLEAIQLARRYKPHLVLTDQMMPNMSGTELLRVIRGEEALRATPVIILTALAGPEPRVAGLEGGADDYLSKPFHERELKARIANLIRSRAQDRQLSELNRRLEARVEEQMAELVRTGQLKRFLPKRVVESALEGKPNETEPFERRRVTALFVDLVGFNDLTGVLEPEDLASVASDFTREMIAIAIKHEGNVASVMGDSIAVLFEAAQASEPSTQAIAALRTALAMREAMPSLETGWRRRGISGAVAVRAGVNTGYCTVGMFGSEYFCSYTAVGTPSHIAAGLRVAAQGGQILCGQSTFALAEGHAVGCAFGPITIDGIPRPIEAFEIKSLSEGKGAYSGESSHPQETPFVAATNTERPMMDLTPEQFARLNRWFNKAVDLAITERAALIEEVRLGEGGEIADKLAGLLAANDRTTGTMGESQIQLPQLAAAGETGAFGEGEVILDRFRIVRVLGRGGMGEVYEAQDRELGPVALKTMRRDLLGDRAVLRRFKQEVHLARQVTSPYVCRIHELFMLPDDGQQRVAAFLTMELLDGVTLASRIEQGPLPWSEAEPVALELCQGLEALHMVGLVHRDFKPANAMLTRRGGMTQAVVMDLGLALRPEESAHGQSRLTLAGSIVGTPLYMAPEQFEGGKVSAATDIYALGLVLYEMTTGKRPFEGSTPLAAAVRRAKRPPTVSSIQPGAPRRLDWIIEKCLQFEPADRFHNAAAVAKALKGSRIRRSTPA